jgi:hypothetical protein
MRVVVGPIPAGIALDSGPRGVAVEFGPKQSNWLIYQLGNPSFVLLSYFYYPQMSVVLVLPWSTNRVST